MTDRSPPAKQRPALIELAKAIASRDAALRRDENGDWRINGKRGHIYAVPEGFQIIIAGDLSTGRWWGAAKRGLACAEVMQDGDEEGSLILDRLPTEEEAEPIRHYLGIGKKRELSPEERELLIRTGHRFQKRPEAEGPLSGQKPPSGD